MNSKTKELHTDQPELDAALEEVLRKLMRVLRHAEGERNVSPKQLKQTVKDFLAKEKF